MSDSKQKRAFSMASPFEKMFADKTIYNAAKATESMVQKIIALEVEQHEKKHPDYVFSNIKVQSKENGCVTYRLEYTHKDIIHAAASK